ncbi:MAG: hypothetical protein PWQ12_819 [Clostridiales bacterium]|jgi:hypothetical protein|nr:hypothetical protein [Clostridiales bacterium]
MTLKKLLSETSTESVMEALVMFYPETAQQSEAYKAVIEYIAAVPYVEFDAFVIEVGLIDPSNEAGYEADVDEDAYLSISGYSASEDLHFALGFTRWEEWANARLEVQEDLMMLPEELIAICVYEMTFYGFDQEAIAQELKDLEHGISNELYH